MNLESSDSLRVIASLSEYAENFKKSVLLLLAIPVSTLSVTVFYLLTYGNEYNSRNNNMSYQLGGVVFGPGATISPDCISVCVCLTSDIPATTTSPPPPLIFTDEPFSVISEN